MHSFHNVHFQELFWRTLIWEEPVKKNLQFFIHEVNFLQLAIINEDKHVSIEQRLWMTVKWQNKSWYNHECETI